MISASVPASWLCGKTCYPKCVDDIDLTLDSGGLDTADIEELHQNILDYSELFSKAPLDTGECPVRPFEDNVPAHTQLVYSRPYGTNHIPKKKIDAILDSYLAAGLIQHLHLSVPVPSSWYP